MFSAFCEPGAASGGTDDAEGSDGADVAEGWISKVGLAGCHFERG